MINVYFNNVEVFQARSNTELLCIKQTLATLKNIPIDDTYAVHNGRVVYNDAVIPDGNLHLVCRLVGGKGGFGSMLRAIGAQIEKTTNREACRDLSGRRLRDINEEKRLKSWINNQSDREAEAVERKQEKIKRLCSKPKHMFEDKHYDKERSEMTENVSSAVEEGFKNVASSSGCQIGHKRKQLAPKQAQKKKPRLWIDADEEDFSSSLDSSDSSSDEEVAKKPTKITTEPNQNIVEDSSTNDNSNSTDGSEVSKAENSTVVKPDIPTAQDAVVV